MKKSVLEYLYGWFNNYAKSFYTLDEKIQHMITLKEEHSLIVAGHCRNLALSLNLPPEDVTLAEAIGLCHDVGRFRQAKLYRTFQDRASVNHGPFGVEQLAAEGINRKICPAEWDIAKFAINCHNAISIPEQADERLTVFAKIVRDADKLDIYRVMPPKPASGGCSPELVENLLSGKLLRYQDLKTPDDRNLVMISWLYDVNYNWTLRQLAAKGYIGKLLDVLPHSPALAGIKERVRNYMAEHTK